MVVTVAKFDAHYTDAIKANGPMYLLRVEIVSLEDNMRRVTDNMARLDAGENGYQFGIKYARMQAEKFAIEKQLDYFKQLLAALEA